MITIYIYIIMCSCNNKNNSYYIQYIIIIVYASIYIIYLYVVYSFYLSIYSVYIEKLGGIFPNTLRGVISDNGILLLKRNIFFEGICSWVLFYVFQALTVST